MNITVSSNYRQLDPADVDATAAALENAWRNPAMPVRQYDRVVSSELRAYREGASIAPYDALIRCVAMLPAALNQSATTLLDVGAASGYYSEVLRRAGYAYSYEGLDYSASYVRMAHMLFPGLNFHRGDARELPFADDRFDIVLHSACIMHLREYEKGISEAIRVTREYVIFHRTPIRQGPTAFYVKDAYGIACLEVHFNEEELQDIFGRCGMETVGTIDIFFDAQKQEGHRSYVLRKA